MNVYETKSMGERIAGNPYVGRGIVIGCTPRGRAAVAYFIMGRSENSRNRVFALREGVLYTEPHDPARVEDPSLIIYAAMRTVGNHLIVTNGDQTDTIAAAMADGGDFSAALTTRTFEPDAPNFTPRISGVVDFANDGFSYRMSILKSADVAGSACARYTFSYPALPAVGHFIHTYVTVGSPLPTFQGEPERVTVPEDIGAFAADIWDHLDENNRIALYVRYTDPCTGASEDLMIDRYRGKGKYHA